MAATAEALAYYANGWYAGGDSRIPGAPLKWENPPTRCIIDVRGSKWGLYLQRGRAVIAAKGFELRWDTAFDEVLDGCGVERNSGEGTWLDASMKDLYRRLLAAGAAHSAEVWLGDELVAGVVGVSVGRWISMETTFHTVSQSGHAAIAAMAELAERRGCVLVDMQQTHNFSRQMGGVEIPRDKYLTLLHAALTPTNAAHHS